MVDDDANIRKITQIVLSRIGHWDVSLAASGQEALKLLANLKVDIILLDVMMPEMDGLTTLSEIKSLLGDLAPPVIFMTAKAQIHEVSSYMRLGAAGVITKPFDPMSLPQEILFICNKWEKEKFALLAGKND